MAPINRAYPFDFVGFFHFPVDVVYDGGDEEGEGNPLGNLGEVDGQDRVGGDEQEASNDEETAGYPDERLDWEAFCNFVESEHDTADL